MRRSSVDRLARSRVLWANFLLLSLLAGRVLADAGTDYNLALKLYQQKRWAQAMEACKEFVAKYPADEKLPLIRLYLAQAQVHQEQFAGAREEFRRFLAAYPQHSERPLALYRVGECSYFLGQFDAARGELRAFLQEFDKHELAPWALVYLGETELRRQDFAAAEPIFRQYRERFPQGALLDEAEMGLARALEGLNRKSEALEVYRQLSQRPGSSFAAEALFNLGARTYEAGDYAQAAATFTSVIDKFPTSDLIGHARMNAGYAYYQLQNYPAAIQQFSAAASDSAQAATAGYWTGLSHKAANQFDQASAVFAATIEKFPETTLADALYFHWGHSELRAGRFDEARRLFLQTVDRYPQSQLADDALYAACEAMLRKGDLTAAEQLNTRFEKEQAESGLRFVQKLLLARLRIAQATAATDSAEKGSRLQQAVESARIVAEGSQLQETWVAARIQWARALDLQGGAAAESIPEVLAPVFEIRDSVHQQDLEAAALLRGKAFLAAKRFTEAQQDFSSVLQLSEVTDRPAALAGLTAARIEARSWPEARQSLEELRGVDSADRHWSQLAMRGGDLAAGAAAWTEAAEFYRLLRKHGETSTYYWPAALALARTEYELKNYAAAALAAESVLEADSVARELQSEAGLLQGLAFRMGGDKPAALAAYAASAERFRAPDDVVTLDEQQLAASLNAYRSAKGGARVARELQQLDQAEQLYQRADRELQRHPAEKEREQDKLLSEWAEMHYSAENFARSDELYRRLVQEVPDSPLAAEASLILAESLRFADQPAAAIAAFEELIQRPGLDETIKSRAEIHLLDLYSQQGNWQQVSKLAGEFRTAHPSGEHAIYAAYRLGEARLRLGDEQTALQTLDDLRQELSLQLTAAPAWWPEIWLLLAETYLQKKQYANLESTLNDLRQRAPDSPLLYRADLILGRALENRAFWDEARAAYRRVLEHPAAARTEAVAEAQFRIAETHLKQKNYAEAFKEYYRVYSGPAFPEWQSLALFQAGMCDKALKNWPGAATSFRDLLKEFPNSDSAPKAQQQLEELAPLLNP